LFASIGLFVLLKIKKIDYTIENALYVPLFKLSFIGFSLMILTLTSSYNYMSTGLATTIHFIYPVAVMVGSVFFYHEKIEKIKIFPLILSLAGMYFLIGFNSLESTSIIGVLLALFSGFSYAYYNNNYCARKNKRDEPICTGFLCFFIYQLYFVCNKYFYGQA